MQGKYYSKRRNDAAEPPPARPSALSLVIYILRSLFTDGMQWLLIPAVLAFLYLRHIHFENEILPVVVFGGLVIMAILNGCKAWQSDLDEYRHQLVLSHQLRAVRKKEGLKDVPGYSPGRRF